MPNYKRDQIVYNYIVRHKSENDGNSPSLRQIMAVCHVTSTSVVANIIQRLERAGKISRIGGVISVTGGRWTLEN